MLSWLKTQPKQFATLILLLILGICCRVAEFRPKYTEGDELIYHALIEQIENGKGYTLQGHAILQNEQIDRKQYDQPYFFHPPGGMILFLIFKKIFGIRGFDGVQIMAFILYFLSMLWLGGYLGVNRSSTHLFSLLAVLTCFSPIMVHVTSYHWLDGPLLAFTTCATALFLSGCQRKRRSLVVLAGILMGWAALIKLTALLGLLFIGVLSFGLLDDQQKKQLTIKNVSLFLCPLILLVVSWQLWKWCQWGVLFTQAPGKPSASLMEGNRYIYFVTILRSPWFYLTHTPQVFWTFVPSLILYLSVRTYAQDFRRLSGILLFIGFVLGVHIFLGFFGYSKVLRYVILISPALTLFFVLALQTFLNNRASYSRGFFNLAISFGFLGAGMEVLQGMYTGFKNPYDLILSMMPLF